MTNIIKRDGRRVPFDLDRLHTVISRACDGLEGVSVSEIEVTSNIQFTDDMHSSRIQEIIIQAATELISASKPNYQYVAARLLSYDLRKLVYGTYYPPSLFEIVKKNVELKVYDAELILDYSDSEYETLDQVINHQRDKTFTRAAMGQLLDKYLLRDRTVGNKYYETPQVMYMTIAMALFSKKPDKSERMASIIKFYNAASTFKFSLPTPIMAGVRTPTRQFSSCVLIKVGDNLNSIKAAGGAIIDYVSKRAGIGIDVGAIRAQGSPIRGGEMTHTGTIPFIKYLKGALKSCSQGGIRGGSATAYFPMWHYQYDDMIVLKNNRGVEANRERQMDYGVQVNRVMIDRLLDKQDIYLFDPKDLGVEAYNAYFNDADRFEYLYECAIRRAEHGEIRFKRLSAEEVWQMFIDERSGTGRIYMAFVDHMNEFSPFTEEEMITQSNLCCEIALPTREFEQYDDPNGRIALCTLASLNMTAFDDPKDIEEVADVLVEALDSLLEYQDYPCMQAREAVIDYRPLGIGIVNLAHFLAKNFCSYGSVAGLALVDEWMAHLHYYLVKASNKQARLLGKCRMPTIHDMGQVTADLAPLPLDILPHGLKPDGLAYGLDWDGLKADLVRYGIRNATLLAIAPTESSSQVLNATNGIEPPKGLVSIKGSKSGMFKQLVPDIEILGPMYELKWDVECREYLKTAAVLQRWVDQSISTNTHYDPAKFPDNKIPRSKMMQDILDFYFWGGKTLYYLTNRDQEEESADKPEAEPVCETCIV